MTWRAIDRDRRFSGPHRRRENRENAPRRPVENSYRFCRASRENLESFPLAPTWNWFAFVGLRHSTIVMTIYILYKILRIVSPFIIEFINGATSFSQLKLGITMRNGLNDPQTWTRFCNVFRIVIALKRRYYTTRMKSNNCRTIAVYFTFDCALNLRHCCTCAISVINMHTTAGRGNVKQ